MLDGIIHYDASGVPTEDGEFVKAADVDEGRCRFNCRTAKENWIEGYVHAVRVENPERRYDTRALRQEAENEYVAWRERKRKATATGRRKADAV